MTADTFLKLAQRKGLLASISILDRNVRVVVAGHGDGDRDYWDAPTVEGAIEKAVKGASKGATFGEATRSLP